MTTTLFRESHMFCCPACDKRYEDSGDQQPTSISCCFLTVCHSCANNMAVCLKCRENLLLGEFRMGPNHGIIEELRRFCKECDALLAPHKETMPIGSSALCDDCRIYSTAGKEVNNLINTCEMIGDIHKKVMNLYDIQVEFVDSMKNVQKELKDLATCEDFMTKRVTLGCHDVTFELTKQHYQEKYITPITQFSQNILEICHKEFTPQLIKVINAGIVAKNPNKNQAFEIDLNNNTKNEIIDEKNKTKETAVKTSDVSQQTENFEGKKIYTDIALLWQMDVKSGNKRYASLSNDKKRMLLTSCSWSTSTIVLIDLARKTSVCVVSMDSYGYALCAQFVTGERTNFVVGTNEGCLVKCLLIGVSYTKVSLGRSPNRSSIRGVSNVTDNPTLFWCVAGGETVFCVSSIDFKWQQFFRRNEHDVDTKEIVDIKQMGNRILLGYEDKVRICEVCNDDNSFSTIQVVLLAGIKSCHQFQVDGSNNLICACSTKNVVIFSMNTNERVKELKFEKAIEGVEIDDFNSMLYVLATSLFCYKY